MILKRPVIFDQSSNPIKFDQICTECGGTFLVKSNHGLTCTNCGLVVMEPKEFSIVQPQWDNKDGLSSAILYKDTTTLASASWKNQVSENNKPCINQSKILTPAETKRSKVYQTIIGVISSMQLPGLIVVRAMYAYDKIIMLLPRRTSIMNVINLTAILIYFSAKQLRYVIFKDDLIKLLGITEKLFNKCLLHVKPFYNCVFKPKNQNDVSKPQLIHAVSIIREFAGNGDYMNLLQELSKTFTRGLVGIREDMRIAVIIFIALKILVPNKIFLTSLAKKLHCRLSSLYNVITRVLCKSGIRVETKLSKLDISTSMKDVLTQNPVIVSFISANKQIPSINRH